MYTVTNLKLGPRLALGFGLVLALMMGVAVIGITRWANLDQSTEAMANDLYPKVITSEKGKELLQKAVDARNRYLGGQADFVKLAKEERKEEAKDRLFAEIHPAQLAYFAAIHKVIDFQAELMGRTSKEATEDYHSTRNLMAGMAIAALLIGALIAIWIMVTVTGPLREAVSVAEKVAEGDLTRRIEAMTQMKELMQQNAALVEEAAAAAESLQAQAQNLEAAVSVFKIGNFAESCPVNRSAEVVHLATAKPVNRPEVREMRLVPAAKGKDKPEAARAKAAAGGG